LNTGWTVETSAGGEAGLGGEDGDGADSDGEDDDRSGKTAEGPSLPRDSVPFG